MPDAPITPDPTLTHEGAKWKHDRPLTAGRFDPSGKFVFTGAEDFFVVRWDLADGKPTKFAGHESWVRAIAFSQDGQTVVTGGYDGRLIWWPATAPQPEPIRKVDAHAGWIRALAVSPDGKILVSVGNDLHVKLWDMAEGKPIRDLAGHASHIYNVAFHPTAPAIATCDLKGVVKHWDLTSDKSIREITAAALHKYDKEFRADIGGARSMAFSADGKFLALGGMTNCTNAFAGIGQPAVAVIDWEKGEVARQHTAKENANGVAWGIRWHPAGYWIGLAGGGGGGFFYFWKPDGPQEFSKLKLPETGRDLDMAGDGLRLAVAHADGFLRIYRMAKKA